MNINQLLDLAVIRKASDLHLMVGFAPHLRIAGNLIPIEGTEELTAAVLSDLILPVLTPLQKQKLDATMELDFSFNFNNQARFRVNIYKEKGQLAAALRMIPFQIPDLTDLGLPKVVEKLVDLHQGFILVTGPTGQGKSTTLAAFINKINQTRPYNIITIEDPVEYVYPKGQSMISQREIYLDTMSWSNALKSALREDPDVVLVGEMRDLETIAAAITIAETGHLVFATLHTNSAAQTIDRIIDVFPSGQQQQVRLQLAATLEAVISQRLVPTIAPGRALAVELLLKTPALGSIIRDGKTHLIDNLIQTSGELGMVSLENSLAELVRSGRVTPDTARNYALNPDLLLKLMR